MASNFGGTIVGAAVTNNYEGGGSNPITPAATPAGKIRKTTIGGNAPAAAIKRATETTMKVNKTAPVEEIKQSSEAIGANLSIRYAFGSQCTQIDALQSFTVPNGGGDKDNSDKILFRVGKQICIFGTDNNSQQFLEGRSRKVKNVLHFCYSANTKYVAACETLRLDRDDEVPAQISVYNIVTMTRFKTLSHQCNADFVQSTFCGDQKFLAALTGDQDRQIVIWQWEKEKVHKLINLASLPVTRIRSSPSNALMITGSGKGVFKCWFLGPDGSPRQNHLLPANRESETFIDHVWLPSAAGVVHKVVALCDFNDTHSVSTTDHGASVSASASFVMLARRQNLFVLEGQDIPNQTNLTSAPISLELRQNISVKINDAAGPSGQTQIHSQPHGPGQGSLSQSVAASTGSASEVLVPLDMPRVEAVIPTTKGFLLIGGLGFVAIYERAVDKRENFVESRRLCLGDMTIIGCSLIQNEEKLVALGRNHRVVCFPLIADDGGTSLQSTAIEDVAIAAITRKVNTTSMSDKDESARKGPETTDLVFGGFHTCSIASMDIAVERPILATVSSIDKTLRLWNYESLECKIVHYFRADEPLAVAIHPAGFQLLVSFKDRIKMYNILADKLRPYKETICKSAKDIRFSHGGHMWAAASAINVIIFDSITFRQLASFQGHITFIRRLTWSAGDEVVFSAGSDGNVYGWPVSKEGRIDCVSASGRSSSAILGIAVDSPMLLFRKSKMHGDGIDEDKHEGELSAQQIREQSCTVIVSTNDGTLKIPSWALDAEHARTLPPAETKVVLPDDRRVHVTALQLSSDRKYLFAGTSNGALRAYLWPPALDDSGNVIDSPYMESAAHAAAVVSIRESPLGTNIISAAEDGSVYIHNFTREVVKPPEKKEERKTGGLPSLNDLLAELNDIDFSFNDDVVMMAHEEVDDHVREIVVLHKELEQQKNQAELSLATKVLQHNDEVKRLTDANEIVVRDEKSKYEHLRIEFDRKVRELLGSIEMKEVEHVKVTSELENRYEHKIADQMERFDRLAENMELLKQKYEGLIEHDRDKHSVEKKTLEVEARLKEKKLRTENRRIAEDRAADGNAFKEILDQQENEYESELRDLVAAAEAELTSEREIIMKLRTLVQTKNTKIDQIKKKLVESNNGLKAKISMLKTEREENKKLHETIEHYKKNLREREEALSEKEKMILELRSTTRTLENFRFVLDHRLQQLSSERGPITAHIEGLERHITTMYEELVEEFDHKKEQAEISEQKDKKISLLSSELSKMRLAGKDNELFIISFKRELGNLVNSMVVGKELEECVRNLYKKYVRGEKVVDTVLRTKAGMREQVNEYINNQDDDAGTVISDINDSIHHHPGQQTAVGAARFTNAKVREVEEALIESAKEAERQKRFVERDCANLRHRLESTSHEVGRIAKTKLAENSNLIFECNNLRREVVELTRKQTEMKAAMQESERQVLKLRAVVREMKEAQRLGIGLSAENQEFAFGETTNVGEVPASATRQSSAKSSSTTLQTNPVNTQINVQFQPMEDTLTMTDALSDRESATFTSKKSKPPVSAKGMRETVPGIAEASSQKKPEDVQTTQTTYGSTAESQTSGQKDSSTRKWVVHNSLAYSQSTGVLKTAPSGIAGSPIKDRSGRVKSAKLGSSQSAALLTGRENVIPENSSHIFNNDVPDEGNAGLNNTSSSATKKSKKVAPPMGGGTMVHAAHNEIVIDKLSSTVEQLASQLDDSNREVEMHKREISRLKRMMLKSASPALPSPTRKVSTSSLSTADANLIAKQNEYAYNAFVGGAGMQQITDGSHIQNLSLDEAGETDGHPDSSIVLGLRNAIRVDRSLTNADITGRPSDKDLLDLSLGPVRAKSANRALRPKLPPSLAAPTPAPAPLASAAISLSNKNRPTSRGKGSIYLPGTSNAGTQSGKLSDMHDDSSQ